MYEVNVEFLISCVDYAIKRSLGTNKYNLFTYEDIVNSKNIILIPFDYNLVECGDLIIWDKHQHEIDSPHKLTEEGIFITKKQIGGCHVAVVEKNNLISDLVLDAPNYIRFRNIEEVKPDKIAKFIV